MVLKQQNQVFPNSCLKSRIFLHFVSELISIIFCYICKSVQEPSYLFEEQSIPDRAHYSNTLGCSTKERYIFQ